MPGKALSLTKKRQIIHEAEDAFWQHAAKANMVKLARPEGQSHKGSHTIAWDFIHLYRKETGKVITIDHKFIIQQAAGAQTQAEANAAKGWLSAAETQVFIDNILECGKQGFPLSHHQLKEHVDEILRAWMGAKFPEGGVGKQWTDQFVEQHSDQLKMSWATPLEAKRGQAVNEHTVGAWFNLLEEINLDHVVEPHNMYGTDEMGTHTSDGEQERVIGGHQPGPQYQ